MNLSQHIQLWFKNHPNLINKYLKYPDHIPGIFRSPQPIEGAVESIKKLKSSEKFDLFIATSAPWGNPESLTDKRYWIENHFGNLFHKKLVTTHRKDLLIGDFLIDDRLKNGAKDFKGELIKFGINWENGIKNEYPNWDSVLKKLLCQG